MTENASIIAHGEGCPRQIVEYSSLVYGFQCHMEFTRDVFELLIAASESELKNLADRRFVQQQPDILHANDYDDMNRKLFGSLDSLVGKYRAATTKRLNDTPSAIRPTSAELEPQG